MGLDTTKEPLKPKFADLKASIEEKLNNWKDLREEIRGKAKASVLDGLGKNAGLTEIEDQLDRLFSSIDDIIEEVDDKIDEKRKLFVEFNKHYDGRSDAERNDAIFLKMKLAVKNLVAVINQLYSYIADELITVLPYLTTLLTEEHLYRVFIVPVSDKYRYRISSSSMDRLEMMKVDLMKTMLRKYSASTTLPYMGLKSQNGETIRDATSKETFNRTLAAAIDKSDLPSDDVSNIQKGAQKQVGTNTGMLPPANLKTDVQAAASEQQTQPESSEQQEQLESLLDDAHDEDTTVMDGGGAMISQKTDDPIEVPVLPSPPKKKRWSRFWRAAAVAVLALGASVTVYGVSRSGTSEQQTAAANASASSSSSVNDAPPPDFPPDVPVKKASFKKTEKKEFVGMHKVNAAYDSPYEKYTRHFRPGGADTHANDLNGAAFSAEIEFDGKETKNGRTFKAVQAVLAQCVERANGWTAGQCKRMAGWFKQKALTTSVDSPDFFKVDINGAGEKFANAVSESLVAYKMPDGVVKLNKDPIKNVAYNRFMRRWRGTEADSMIKCLEKTDAEIDSKSLPSVDPDENVVNFMKILRKHAQKAWDDDKDKIDGSLWLVGNMEKGRGKKGSDYEKLRQAFEVLEVHTEDGKVIDMKPSKKGDAAEKKDKSKKAEPKHGFRNTPSSRPTYGYLDGYIQDGARPVYSVVPDTDAIDSEWVSNAPERTASTGTVKENTKIRPGSSNNVRMDHITKGAAKYSERIADPLSKERLSRRFILGGANKSFEQQFMDRLAGLSDQKRTAAKFVYEKWRAEGKSPLSILSSSSSSNGSSSGIVATLDTEKGERFIKEVRSAIAG